MQKDQFVVGIGASAGGLEAFSDFFDHAAENPDISYILIQHLSPDYKSLLADLLSRHTKMQVREAEDNMRITGNCVYVIPPRKSMTVHKGFLRLTDKNPKDKGPHISIDTFFNSLAAAYEDKSVAIVLSGTGTDGSRGIQAVKESGGLVIVQDPETAKFDGMPRSCIATDCVDMVLPADKMYEELAGYINGVVKDNLDPELMGSLFTRLQTDTGCDFQLYKQPTVIRRLKRRMASLKIPSLDQYIKYIGEYQDESHIFCKDLLIGVTSFFRDPEAFESLRRNALEPLVHSKKNGDNIKVWVTACSTGEEAYSIAFVLNDLIEQSGKEIDLKIFATDVNSSNIEKASKAQYDLQAEKDIPEDVFRNYFTKKENYCIVAPAIRKLIVFAKHNIASDPPFIKNDLVSCRNMLIYMNQALQGRIISRFVFSLNANGYLFLGPSENIASYKEVLIECDRKWKIYRKNELTKPAYNLMNSAPVKMRENGSKPKVNGLKEQQVNSNPFMSDFAIAGFYIDTQYKIHEVFGNNRHLVNIISGDFELNLLKLMPEVISIPLNTALLKAWKYKEKQFISRLNYRTEKKIYNIEISVRPPNESNTLTAVLFNIMDSPVEPGTIGTESSGNNSAELEHLRNELRESRFNLQTAIEELETTNEELQSSNEELLSANEELQSSNEELQSVNEELHTLNTEHQQRIRDLVELNDDLNNYFKGSDVGQIIVDKRMRIRKFNPAAARLINLIDKDTDRLLTDLTINFEYENFEKDIKSVLIANKRIEREIVLNDSRNYIIRIHSYVTQAGEIDGALLTFVDITDYKELYSIINGVFDASKAAIIVLKAVYGPNKEVIHFNTVAANYSANELFKRNLSAQLYPLHELNKTFYAYIYNDLCRVLATGISSTVELEMDDKWFQVVAVSIPNGVALTLNDVTERRRSETKLRKSYAEIYSIKENLRKLNRELEELVQKRTHELSVSEERFRLVAQVTNDTVIDWNFMNNTLWVSDNYFKLYGYTADQVMDNYDFLISRIHPADRDKVQRSLTESLYSVSGIWKCEYRYLSADNSVHTISDRGFFMTDESGTPYRMLRSMLDITDLRETEQELHESEARLMMAIDVPDVAGWDFDIVTNELIYSENLPAIFGLKNDQKYTRAIFREHLHPDDVETVNKAFNDALTSGKYEFEARVIWPGNNIQWISTKGKVFFDDNRVPVRMSGIVRKVTVEKNNSIELEDNVRRRTAELRLKNEEVIEANNRLMELNVKLEKSNSDLEQFAYIASHDLQEPLRKIQTFISVLQSAGKKDETKTNAYLDKIAASAARMSAMIQNVLEYSRLLRSEFAYSSIDLNDLLKQLLVDFELLIQEKHVKVILDKLPVVYGINHQVSQLFFNLLSNALKFTSENPQIHISYEIIHSRALMEKLHVDNDSFYSISIKDNGIGFDQKYAEDIFSFFYRLDTERKYSGSGIGLAICRKIMQNHNGTIEVESAEGKGSEFKVILPVHQKLK